MNHLRRSHRRLTSAPLRAFFSSNDQGTVTAEARRAARREARRARDADLAAKQAQLELLLERHPSESTTLPSQPSSAASPTGLPSTSNRGEDDISSNEEERTSLLVEASAMTRSLYRTCLRSVEVVRPGNDRDEADFKEREEAQLRMFDDADKGSDTDAASAFAPPVDRANELRSRAEYYAEWTRENFNQESDCLASDPWREDDVTRYLHFLRVGEERRRWVLEEYGFDDPFSDRFDTDRVDRFEERALRLLRETYGARGWMLNDDRKRAQEGEKDPCIFDDDDDFLGR